MNLEVLYGATEYIQNRWAIAMGDKYRGNFEQ